MESVIFSFGIWEQTARTGHALQRRKGSSRQRSWGEGVGLSVGHRGDRTPAWGGDRQGRHREHKGKTCVILSYSSGAALASSMSHLSSNCTLNRFFSRWCCAMLALLQDSYGSFHLNDKSDEISGHCSSSDIHMDQSKISLFVFSVSKRVLLLLLPMTFSFKGKKKKGKGPASSSVWSSHSRPAISLPEVTPLAWPCSQHSCREASRMQTRWCCMTDVCYCPSNEADSGWKNVFVWFQSDGLS